MENEEGWMNVIIKSRSIETDRIVSFELIAADGSDLPPFSAGAHVDVLVEENLIRQYSLSNNPQERHRYRLGVLNDENSRGGSKAIHEGFEVGQEISIRPPRNNFELDKTGCTKHLFGGGIGITPLISMAYAVRDAAGMFRMHYSSRSQDVTAFRAELTTEFPGSINIYHDDEAIEERLKVDDVMAEIGGGEHIYICGPTGYIDYISNAAKAAQISPDRIHIEHFGNVVAHQADNSFEVIAVKSGKTILVKDGQTIVEALADSDIELDVSCEQGVCGTCITNVLEGAPDHRDLFLDDDEKASNTLIMPCCSRSLTPQIKLDI